MCQLSRPRLSYMLGRLSHLGYCNIKTILFSLNKDTLYRLKYQARYVHLPRYYPLLNPVVNPCNAAGRLERVPSTDHMSLKGISDRPIHEYSGVSKWGWGQRGGCTYSRIAALSKRGRGDPEITRLRSGISVSSVNMVEHHWNSRSLV